MYSNKCKSKKQNSFLTFSFYVLIVVNFPMNQHVFLFQVFFKVVVLNAHNSHKPHSQIQIFMIYCNSTSYSNKLLGHVQIRLRWYLYWPITFGYGLFKLFIKVTMGRIIKIDDCFIFVKYWNTNLHVQKCSLF